MSGREFKPGDVAMVTWQDGKSEVMFRFLGGDDYDIPEWQTAADGCGYPTQRQLRPLVVIDPEDREQVERLAKAYHEADHIAPWPELHNVTRVAITDSLVYALRRLVAPPEPEEPTGLGAVEGVTA